MYRVTFQENNALNQGLLAVVLAHLLKTLDPLLFAGPCIFKIRANLLGSTGLYMEPHVGVVHACKMYSMSCTSTRLLLPHPIINSNNSVIVGNNEWWNCDSVMFLDLG